MKINHISRYSFSHDTKPPLSSLSRDLQGVHYYQLAYCLIELQLGDDRLTLECERAAA